MYCNFVSVTIKEEFPHSVSRSHIKNPFLRIQSERRIPCRRRSLRFPLFSGGCFGAGERGELRDSVAWLYMLLV